MELYALLLTPSSKRHFYLIFSIFGWWNIGCGYFLFIPLVKQNVLTNSCVLMIRPLFFLYDRIEVVGSDVFFSVRKSKKNKAYVCIVTIKITIPINGTRNLPRFYENSYIYYIQFGAFMVIEWGYVAYRRELRNKNRY